MTSRSVIAVDLGKSRCRAVDATHGRRPIHDGVGAPGLAAAGGVEAALGALLPAMRQFEERVDVIAIGAAGAWTAPEAAAELARRLAESIGASVVVTSDVVSAHAGALQGGSGVLLIAGTGAAALAIDGDGARLIDGWGPELGDFGSGSWLGREALRAVLRAAHGLGPATALTAGVAPTVGDPSSIAGWLRQDGHLARRLATLAPLVLDAAEAGDEAAKGIAEDGIRLLTATAVAASSAPAGVALHGGLTAHPWFRSRLETALRAEERRVVPSAGDALDGARLLALQDDLPHERFVHRAE